MKKSPGNVYFYLLAAFLLIIDQFSKLAVKGFHLFGINHNGLSVGDSIPVIGKFIQLTYVENSGMAFGITFGPGKIFLSLFSVIASIMLVWYINKLKNSSPWVRLGLAWILAGAAGNLVDRVFYGLIYGDAPIFYGKVVDFIQVDIPDINIFGLYYTHWPVFNVADACVTIGVIILLFFHKSIPSFKELTGKESNSEIERKNLKEA